MCSEETSREEEAGKKLEVVKPENTEASGVTTVPLCVSVGLISRRETVVG